MICIFESSWQLSTAGKVASRMFTLLIILRVCVYTDTPDVATAVCSPVAAFAKVELIYLVVLKKKMLQMSLRCSQTNIVHCYCVFHSGAICATQWWEVGWRTDHLLGQMRVLLFYSPIVGFIYPITCLLRGKHNTDAAADVLIRSDVATLSKCAPCRF